MRHALALSTCLAIPALATAQVADWHRLAWPTGMATKRLAFDSARERMIMFEGSGWGRLSRTWEWAGEEWSLRRTATSPPMRHGFAMTYDPVRRRVVLFGGSTIYYYTQPGVMLADTWEYDGIDWVQRTPTTSPPPQAFGSMVFDYANNQVLLCGGEAYPVQAGAWLYDGATWTSVAPLGNSATSFASDPIRQRVVAYSISYPTGSPVSVTFEWDGTSWMQLSPPQHPPPRLGGRLAFVAQRGTVVLHGGYSTVSSQVFSTDLWEWNGSNWNVIAAPPARPRAQHALEHDSARNRLFAVGGYDTGNADMETLQWDGTTWLASSPTIGWDTVANAYFDSKRRRVVAFSQNPSSWLEWDGARWHRAAIPPGGGGSSLAYDQARQRAVALQSTGGTLSIAEWDGTTWSAIPAATPPIGNLVYHAGIGRVVALSASALWAWNGTTWNQIAPGLGAFLEHLAYDAARNEIVVHTWSGVTATWNGITWTQHVSTTGPAQRTNYSLGCDEIRQRVVLFGGRDPSQFLFFFDDLWEWNGASWSQRITANAPAPRENAALVFDPLRKQLLVVGGNRQEHNGATLMFGDVWALDSMAVATVTTLGPGCGGSSAVPVLVPSSPHPGAAAFTIDLHTALATTPCLFGFSLTSGAVPLGGGCTLFVPGLDALHVTVTSASGFSSTQASIPLALQGFTFAVQGAVLDATSPLGVSLSQGLSIVVGR